MKKLVVLHPPFYQTNYGFYHELGKLVELCVFMFGDRPKENPAWCAANLYRPERHSFKLRLFGAGEYPRSEIYSGRFLVALSREKPEAVLTVAFAPYGIYAGLCAGLLGYRFYLLSDSNHESESGLNSWRQRSRSFLLGLCRKALSASPASSSYLRWLCPSVQIVEGLQAADVSFYLCQSQKFAGQRPQLRHALAQQICQSRRGPQLDKEIFVPQFCASAVWLGVGRLIASKRWHWGLKLLQRHSQLHYVLVGKGELAQQLVEAAKQQGVIERFHLVPFVGPEKLARYYNAADLLYFPAEGETFGFVVTEALASGCPVLCSEHIGASALVQENINGWHGVEGPGGDGLLPPHKISQILAQLATMQQHCRDSVEEYTSLQQAKRFCRSMDLED